MNGRRSAGSSPLNHPGGGQTGLINKEKREREKKDNTLDLLSIGTTAGKRFRGCTLAKTSDKRAGAAAASGRTTTKQSIRH
ncbi:hypothetical protein F2P81_015994 [Scophthalmus maximus]|uniref:Uncharacterized protein n=1 Tax=Scophthalmus maximus TaxID=52904 RepID=A0A6A4SG18_SCOMX|nr:hypothetical protein F2P81_015994 [Scophthalmus maximus]